MLEKELITSEILALWNAWEIKLASLPESLITSRRNSQDRTIKQITGHLIDSTANNIMRAIHLQNLSSPLDFPNYATFGNNDRWIAIQNYQEEDWQAMIQHLRFSLLHLCHVIRNIDESKLDNQWIAGPDKFITLGEMINFFLPHFKLHLGEIDELLKD
jgi:hypothetical protein